METIKEILKEDIDIIILTLGAIMISMVVVFMVVLGFGYMEYRYDSRKWNNGYCSCGGKWEYNQPMACDSGILYLYQCDTCGRVQSFQKWRPEIKN